MIYHIDSTVLIRSALLAVGISAAACAPATGIPTTLPTGSTPASSAVPDSAAIDVDLVEGSYEQGTLGRALQTELAGINARCISPTTPRVRRLVAPGETAVLEVLGTHEPMTSEIYRISGADLGPIFRFVFSAEDLSNFTQERTVPGRILESVTGDRPTPNLEFGNALYLHSCVSLLRAAIEARANQNWPIAHIRGALNAEFDNSKKVHYSLIYGRFDSPLSRTLQFGTAPQRLNGQLRIWRLYRANPALVEKEHWVIDNLTGWMVAELQEATRRTQGNVELDAGGNWIVASVNTTLAASANTDSRLVSNAFRLYVSPREGTVSETSAQYGGFFQLPSVERIQQTLDNSVKPYLSEDPARSVASSGGTQWHQQVIQGMPRELCDAGEWNDENVRAVGNAYGTITVRDILWDAEVGSCKFLIAYTPDWASIPQSALAAGELRIRYEFNSVTGIRTASAETPLMIRAGARIPLSTQPLALPRSTATPSVPATLVDSAVEVSFRIDFRILDDQVGVDRQQFGQAGRAMMQDVTLTCGDWTKNGRGWISPSGGEYDLQGTIRFPVTDAPPTSECEIATTLSIPRRTGMGFFVRNFVGSLRITGLQQIETRPVAP